MNGGIIPRSMQEKARISRRVERFDRSGDGIYTMYSLVSCAMRRSDGNS
jgi:hypothetical protein